MNNTNYSLYSSLADLSGNAAIGGGGDSFKQEDRVQLRELTEQGQDHKQQ